MSDARARGWGNPDDPHYQRDHITTIHIGGVHLAVRREVAPLFTAFIVELASRGYPLDRTADDWGYANRDIRGRPGVKSNHAWGLAVDLNSTSNPMTSDGQVHTDMPSWVPIVANSYGLAWGGDYRGSRKDPMHFEFVGTPAEAAVYVAALKEEDLTPDQAQQLANVAAAVGRLEDHVQAIQNDIAELKNKLKNKP